jgi:ABC-type transporter Mla MlaB component
MATKDTSTGLLARVANFVRSPATGVSAPEVPTQAEQGESGKLAIKQMIERKAHNDAVRKREFSQLRKLREASPAALSEMAARASFFPDSSGFSESEGRASTLKKIDEIEAQMSKQWWNGQQRKSADGAASSPPVQTAPSATSVQPMAESAASAGLSRGSASAVPSQLETCNAFAPTQPTDWDEPQQSPVSRTSSDRAGLEKSRSAAWAPPGFPGFEATDYSGFSSSNMVSVEMGQVLSDPVLEDAAIRFANSDDAGAESVLILALQGPAVSPQAQEAWRVALLDLYRSTGQQAQYERLALDYAEQSDRGTRRACAPTGMVLASAQARSERSAGGGYVEWQSPMVLDSASVELLQATVPARHTSVRLDWQAVKAITPDAAAKLAALVGQWCERRLVLQFDGLECLDILLRLNTTLGDKEVPQSWWHLRLSILRVLGAQDEFELVSMDYCMTYDISPPAWQSAHCQRVFDLLARVNGGDAPSPGVHDTTLPLSLTVPAAFVSADAQRLELAGELLGTDAAALKPLQTALQSQGDLLVNGERLVRVDFLAAGSILNWVASAQAPGKKIEFAQLPHLVAAFFNLIGINEHARVTARSN